MSPASKGQSGGSAAAAADKVRAILEAAEQSATALRAEAAQEIEAQLARAQAAAERLSARADQIERSLEGIADGVRDELSSLKADLEELRAVSEHVGATRVEPGDEEPAAPAAPPAAEAAGEEAVPEQPSPEEPAPEEPPPPTASPAQPPARSGDGHEGARVIALNMALSGSSRDETARYLAENFELEDPDALLDEVYARVSR